MLKSPCGACRDAANVNCLANSYRIHRINIRKTACLRTKRAKFAVSAHDYAHVVLVPTYGVLLTPASLNRRSAPLSRQTRCGKDGKRGETLEES